MTRVLAALTVIAITGVVRRTTPLDACAPSMACGPTAFDWISGSIKRERYSSRVCAPTQDSRTARKRGSKCRQSIEVCRPPAMRSDNAYIASMESPERTRRGTASGAHQRTGTRPLWSRRTMSPRSSRHPHHCQRRSRLLLGEVRATGDRQIAEGSPPLPGVLGVVNQLRVNTR